MTTDWKLSDTPDIDKMMDEFERSGGLSACAIKRERNHNIRYCRWDGRTSDYKKHRSALNAEPVPWENAWDGRIYLADNIINDLGDVLSSAFRRAQLAARPVEAQDTAQAGMASLVLNKYRERMAPELNDEAEFLWQFALTQGAAVWQVGWDRQIALGVQPIRLQDFEPAVTAAVARLTGPDQAQLTEEETRQIMDLIELPVLIMAPTEEERAVKAMQTFAAELARGLFRNVRGIDEDDWLTNYKLSARQAREVVRDLREEGSGEFPAPFITRNQPFLVARQVGYDYFAPPEMTELQTSPWHAVRDWLTPEQIMENVRTDGWDETWAKGAIETKGKTSTWGEFVTLGQYAVDSESEAGSFTYADTKSGLVEIIWWYKRYVTEEGIPQIWCTVWCPAMTSTETGQKTWAKHAPTNDAHGKYPFVDFRWQKPTRNFHDVLGIPEIVGSDQQSIKRSIDMLVDRQELEINPPWLVANRLSMRYKAGPGAQIPRKRKDDFEPAPPPTGNPDLAFQLVELGHKRVSQYFGLVNEYVLPAKWQAKLQALTERYLAACSAAFTMMFQLVQQYASDYELERLSEGASNFPRSLAEIQGQYDVTLTFSVQDLDSEFVWKKLEALTKWAVPLDRAGVIDMATLARLIVTAIDPTYARVLLQSPQEASQKLFSGVKTDLALMALGNEADYTENDPAADIKLKFAQDVIRANPKYKQALQQDPLFAELVQKYEKNLLQSVKQEQNKQIGRLGVQPQMEA